MMDVIVTAIRSIVIESWNVTALMAPYLLLGFLVAGALSVWISPRWLQAHLGGGGFGPVWKAALFGVPLPLCSCGVIPVGASLRQSGASPGATTAFLLSTPQTGVDSVSVTYSVLGPVIAIYRPVIALITGLVGGGLVRFLDRDGGEDDGVARAARMVVRPQGVVNKTIAALEYGFLSLPRDIGRALLVGVVIAGLLAALIPPDFLAPYLSSGIVAALVMMAVGIPLYVCATASVPVAAAFIHLGVSPGAALAFLIAGPATNAAAITTVWRVLGRRTALVYLGTVAVSALGSALLLDALTPWVATILPNLHVDHSGHDQPGWFAHLCAVVLVGLLLYAFRPRRGAPKSDAGSAAGDHDMADGNRRIDLTVQGMNCNHCSNSVQQTLEDVAGVARVAVDLAGERATVEGADLDAQLLVEKVNALGFRAAVATD